MANTGSYNADEAAAVTSMGSRLRSTSLAFFVPFLVATSSLCAIAETAAGRGLRQLEPAVAARVDSIFAEFDSTTPGCAVGIYRDDAIVHANGYGMADLEQRVPIVPGSIFQIASASKQFTAMAMLLLEQDGRISLDDDIRRYIPEVPDLGHTITIRQMIHHTSGMRDLLGPLAWTGTLYPSDPITVREALELVGRQTGMNSEPGAEYSYNNTAYWLMGLVPERVVGQSLREYTEEKIFAPLGMTSTHFHDDPAGLIHGGRTRAYVWRSASEDWALSEPVYEVVGAGGLYTTVEDLFAWHRNFSHGLVGGEDGVRAMHEQGILSSGDTLDYALALVTRDYRGLRVWEHSGADGGYRSHVLRIPEEQFGAAILCNQGSAGPASRAYEIVDLLLGQRLEPETGPVVEPERPLAPEALRGLVGLYRNPSSGELLRLREVDGELRLGAAGGGGGSRLVPLGDVRFRVGAEGDEVIGIESDRGRAVLRRPHPYRSGDTLSFEAVPAVTPGRAELSAYAGDYWSDDVGVTFTLLVDGDDLVLRRRKLEDARLVPTVADVFVTGFARYTFRRGSDGAVNAFTIDAGRGKGFLFTRSGGAQPE